MKELRMQHTSPAACLSLALLRYVRDQKPTEAQLLDWLGVADASKLYVLKKAGLLQCNDGQVRLSPAHVSAAGKMFRFEDKHFLLDEDLVRIVRRSHNG